jgi:hypothetical protein
VASCATECVSGAAPARACPTCRGGPTGARPADERRPAPSIVVVTGPRADERVLGAIARFGTRDQFGDGGGHMAYSEQEVRSLSRTAPAAVGYAGNVDAEAVSALVESAFAGHRSYVASSLPFDLMRARLLAAAADQFGPEHGLTVVSLD